MEKHFNLQDIAELLSKHSSIVIMQFSRSLCRKSFMHEKRKVPTTCYCCGTSLISIFPLLPCHARKTFYWLNDARVSHFPKNIGRSSKDRKVCREFNEVNLQLDFPSSFALKRNFPFMSGEEKNEFPSPGKCFCLLENLSIKMIN